MKKVASFVLALCLMVSVLAVPQEASAAAAVGRVTNLKSGICTTRSINLRWNPVQGAAGYQIYRSEARNGKYRKIKEVRGQAFMNTTVVAGKEYFYKVRAFDHRRKCGKFSSPLRANTKQLYNPQVRAKYNVNIRKYAGTDYAVRCTVRRGQKMTVLCSAQDRAGVKWYRVQLKVNRKKLTGYVRSDLVG